MSCIKSNTSSPHKDSPVAEAVYPLFWGPSLYITDRDRLRKRLGGHQPVKGWAFSLPSLVQSQTSAQRIKTVQCPKQFLLFFGEQVIATQIKTKEETFWWHRALKASALRLPSLVQSLPSDQCINTVQCPKQFFLFWGTQSASQIKTKEETFGGTPTHERLSI